MIDKKYTEVLKIFYFLQGATLLTPNRDYTVLMNCLDSMRYQFVHEELQKMTNTKISNEEFADAILDAFKEIIDKAMVAVLGNSEGGKVIM